MRYNLSAARIAVGRYKLQLGQFKSLGLSDRFRYKRIHLYYLADSGEGQVRTIMKLVNREDDYANSIPEQPSRSTS
jgi:hypothetical protein